MMMMMMMMMLNMASYSIHIIFPECNRNPTSVRLSGVKFEGCESFVKLFWTIRVQETKSWFPFSDNLWCRFWTRHLLLAGGDSAGATRGSGQVMNG